MKNIKRVENQPIIIFLWL